MHKTKQMANCMLGMNAVTSNCISWKGSWAISLPEKYLESFLAILSLAKPAYSSFLLFLLNYMKELKVHCWFCSPEVAEKSTTTTKTSIFKLLTHQTYSGIWNSIWQNKPSPAWKSWGGLCGQGSFGRTFPSPVMGSQSVQLAGPWTVAGLHAHTSKPLVLVV